MTTQVIHQISLYVAFGYFPKSKCSSKNKDLKALMVFIRAASPLEASLKEPKCHHQNKWSVSQGDYEGGVTVNDTGISKYLKQDLLRPNPYSGVLQSTGFQRGGPGSVTEQQ